MLLIFNRGNCLSLCDSCSVWKLFQFLSKLFAIYLNSLFQDRKCIDS